MKLPHIPRPLEGHVTGCLVFAALLMLALALSGCLLAPWTIADKAFTGVGILIDQIEEPDDPKPSD